MTAWTEAYLHFNTAAPDPCRRLYLQIVRDRAGVALPDYEVSADRLAWARGIERERQSGEWLPIEPGDERELDLVLMREFVGRGEHVRPLGLHCGCVVKPGLMIDIKASGVRVVQFRDTLRKKADGTVKHDVLGIYRPKVLAA